jgi:3D (Asp-Asp-Asp) domain-containing protein
MKKTINELIPFSRFEQATIYLIIACVFQFLLFFTPQLADQAMAQELLMNNREEKVLLSSVIKNREIDPVVANYISSQDINKHFYPFQDIEEEVVEIEAEDVLLKEEKREEIKVLRTSFHYVTAYNSLPEQTNDQPCITANGFNVCEHGIEDTIAANFLKFGTKVRMPDLFGDRIFIVRDRMNKRYPDRVDVWMLEKSEAISFGIKKAKIEIVEYVN